MATDVPIRPRPGTPLRPGTRRQLVVVAAFVVVLILAVLFVLVPMLRSMFGGEPMTQVVPPAPITALAPASNVILDGATVIAAKDEQHYAGAWWDDAAHQAVLNVVGDAQVDSARKALAAAGLQAVHVRVITRSTEELRALARKVVTAPSPLHENLVGAHPDARRDLLLVTVTTATDDVRRQVQQIAGDAAVLVESGPAK